MGRVGCGQSPWFGGNAAGAGRASQGAMGAMMSQMMMQAMMQMMMGLLSQCFSQCSGGAFSPQRSPAFGGCGSMGGSGNFGGGGGMCQPFNPCQNFLGGGNAASYGGGNASYGGGGHYGGGRYGPQGQGAVQERGGAQGVDSAGGSANTNVPISARSKELIKKSEGFDQPGKWPGASSGITLGVGYDLGYVTKEEFRRDWKDKLPTDQMARLERAIGVKGKDAKAIASQFSDINVSKGAANQVFESATLPKFYAQAKKAFPGMEKLPPDAQGALTSLVFNRGASMKGDRREEMRNIRSLVSSYQPSNPTAALNRIAGEFRDMKRLWAGQGLNGLLTRRDNEANLVQGAGYGGGMMLASR